jgi:hypothetical protein
MSTTLVLSNPSSDRDVLSGHLVVQQTTKPLADASKKIATYARSINSSIEECKTGRKKRKAGGMKTIGANTQRTLGKQFHLMDRTLRIVSQGAADPLTNDLVWYGLISDLMCIGFIKDDAPSKWKWRKNYFDGVPLALRPRDKVWTVYRRVLNQLPLSNAIHLAVYRWITSVCRVAIRQRTSTSFFPRKCLLRIAEEVKEFLKVLFDRSKFEDHRKTATADSTHTKVKFRLTVSGRELLHNAYTTFQPVIPESLRPIVQNSLHSKHIYCPLPSLVKRNKRSSSLVGSQARPQLYVHEHNAEVGKEALLGEQSGTLSEIIFYSSKTARGNQPVEGIRRVILQHLSGFMEGCAIFGLHQMFGNGDRYMFKLHMIRLFVEKITESISAERLEKKRKKKQVSESAKITAPAPLSKRKADKTIPVVQKKKKQNLQPEDGESDAALLLLLCK